MIYKFTQKDLADLAYDSLVDVSPSVKYKAVWHVNMGVPESESITMELVEIDKDLE